MQPDGMASSPLSMPLFIMFKLLPWEVALPRVLTWWDNDTDATRFYTSLGDHFDS
jgi:hypothetical protein